MTLTIADILAEKGIITDFSGQGDKAELAKKAIGLQTIVVHHNESNKVALLEAKLAEKAAARARRNKNRGGM